MRPPAVESLPPALARALQELRAQTGAAAPALWRVRAQELERYRHWCRRALGRVHLVVVASTLLRELAADVDDLDALGLPVDLLQQFPSWRLGSRDGFRPRSLGLAPVPVGAGHAIRSLRLQLSPGPRTVSYALLLLRGLLRRMDPAVRFVVVVEPGANLEALGRLAEDFVRGGSGRVRFVPTRPGGRPSGPLGEVAIPDTRTRGARSVEHVPRACDVEHLGACPGIARRPQCRSNGA